MTARTFSLASDPCLADHAVEGTPLVPFALAAGELLAAAGAAALDGFAIELPLMLRRGRDKAVSVVHSGGEVALTDAGGVVHARGRVVGAPAPPASPGASCGQRECPYRALAGGQTVGIAPRHAACLSGGSLVGRGLYGTLFFHGPSFQVDWSVRAAHAGGLLACLIGADPSAPAFSRYCWNASFPALLADLALQAGALHYALTEHRFGLPEACERVAGFGGGPGPHTVRVTCRDGVRDLVVTDGTGRAELVFAGLRLRPVERPIPAPVLDVLTELANRRRSA